MAVNLLRNISVSGSFVSRIVFQRSQILKGHSAACICNTNSNPLNNVFLYQSVNLPPIVIRKSLFPVFSPSPTFFNQLHSGGRTRKKLRSFSSTPQNDDDDDDLRAILKDKSLSLTAKFKIIFRQYGVVMVAVYLVTSAMWIAIFYTAVKRGVDVTPFLERIGVFDYMEKWGISFVDKLKTSGASDYVVTYVLYELAKPIRYIVILFGTMYSVRFFRRRGIMKPPPKSATVSSLVQTQSKIVSNRLRRRTKHYTDKYKSRLKLNGKKNGKRPPGNL